ncbi:MAG: DUF86 domain-containing protein [candidate division WOR-3 bacterium]
MPRDYKAFLEDIVEAATVARQFVAGMTKEQFAQDRKTRDAVVRNLEVIGEAVKKVSDEIKDKYPEVEWKKIAGLRDILIHDYFGIDTDIIWDVIQNKLPTLIKQLQQILAAP